MKKRKSFYRKVSIHAPARGATEIVLHGIFSDTVSIHAPARGATLDKFDFRFCERVSIHAPARGATQSERQQGLSTCFNPRTRKGCDLVSIALKRNKFRFNPRTRKGCDNTSIFLRIKNNVSIHAPARGATRV